MAQAPQAPRPRVALLYSDYGDFRHRDDYDARLKALGWAMDKYENTQFGELAAKLDQYDLVLGSALYNYSKVQDFSRWREQMMQFMQRGGAFVFTDVNYAVHVDWLRDFGEGYAVEIAKCEHAGQEAQVLEPAHPLLNFPQPWQPRCSWSHMKCGPKWRVLARCPEGSDLLALAEFGRGFMWLSGFWPLSEPQLNNLWEYVRSRRAGIELVSSRGVDEVHPGLCEARVTFRTLDQQGVTGVAWCVLQPDGKRARAVGEVTGNARDGFSAQLQLELNQRGKHLSWIEFESPSGEAIYATTAVEVTVPELIEVRLLAPAYRQAIYLSTGASQIRLRFTSHPYGEDLKGARVRLVATQGAKVIGQQEGPVPAERGVEHELSAPLRDLQPGGIDLRFVLEKDGRRLWSRTWGLEVVAPTKPQVALGDNLETYVDGQPFFPIGVYHIAPEFYDQAREMGFNCIQAWGNTVEGARQALDTAAAHGLKVILEMSGFLRGEYRPEPFREVVRACRNHPALLAWYPVDEPGPQQYEWCLDAYRICRDEDPHHPVYLVMCDPGAFGRFAATTDVLAIDPYPVPHAPLRTVASWSARAREVLGGQQAFWLIPQLHNIAAYSGDPSKGRAPTGPEEWCMVFQGLIYGAKGVVYYPWDDGKCGLVHEPALMAELPRINRFLGELGKEIAAAPAELLAGLGVNSGNSDELHAALFRGKRVLLLATNSGAETATLSLELPGEGNVARSVLDDRVWQVRGGRLELRLAGTEVVAAELQTRR